MASLKERTVSGVGWSFADNIINTGITFITGIILARILSPSEFGILGMITVFIAISHSIIDSGFSSALVRKKDAGRQDYNTAFYFNILVGAILFLVMFLSAPSISAFYKEPILKNVVRVMSVTLIIDSLSLIQTTILIRKIDFKTQTKVSLFTSLLSGCIGITMALLGYGVWSLVVQQVARQTFKSILLWTLNKWRPGTEVSLKSLKELYGFGSKLLVSGLIDTIYKNIYYLVIGKFYRADQLGQYTRAEGFNSVFSSNLTAIIQRVSYPVLSGIQNDARVLKLTYRRIIKTTMFVTFTCMLGLSAIAKPLVLVLVGEKWTQAASFLSIICFAGMLYPLHAINLNILKVKGRSDLYLRLEIVKKAIASIPICLGIFLGIKFMLWGSVFTSFISLFLNSYYSGTLVSYSIREQISDISGSFLISAVMAALVYSFSALFSIPVLIQLILQVITGIILIVGASEIFHFEDYLYIKKLIKEKIVR